MQNLRRSSLSDGGASASRGVPGTPKNQKMRASARGGTLKGNECSATVSFGTMDDGIKKRTEEDEGEGRASVSFRFVRPRAFRRHGCDSSRAGMDGWMDGWYPDGGKQTRKTRADAKKIEPTE